MKQLYLFEGFEHIDPPNFSLDALMNAQIIEVGKALLKDNVKKQTNGTCYKGRCPTDHKEKTPSFYLKPIANFYVCYGCGKSGGPLALPFAVNSNECEDPWKFYRTYFGFKIEEEEHRETLREVLFDVMGYKRWTESYTEIINELISKEQYY